MDFWDSIAGLYDLAESLNKSVYHEMTALTARLVPRGARVLDCAAGTGELSLAAAKRAEIVVCTDLSQKMLNNAKRKADSSGVDNIEFDKRNIFDLQDKDNTYDVVIAGNVLHLLGNPQGAIKELYRVTKIGGRLLLPTFMTSGNNQMLIRLYKLIGFNPMSEYTPKAYREMLESSGCGSVKMKLIKGRIPCCYAVMTK